MPLPHSIAAIANFRLRTETAALISDNPGG